VKKEVARPFKVADNIIMRVIDPVTGKKPDRGAKSTIIEAYKNLPNDNIANQNISDRLKNDNILRFY
jgi:penicillin-binding protein 1A